MLIELPKKSKKNSESRRIDEKGTVDGTKWSALAKILPKMPEERIQIILFNALLALFESV